MEDSDEASQVILGARHGRQFEHSLALVPEQNRAAARALASEVVLGHRARARALI